MTKPILVIYAPDRIIPPEEQDRVRGGAAHLVQNEYYILVVPTKGAEFHFEAFYEKDFNEVKYEELMKKIKDQFKA